MGDIKIGLPNQYYILPFDIYIYNVYEMTAHLITLETTAIYNHEKSLKSPKPAEIRVKPCLFS